MCMNCNHSWTKQSEFVSETGVELLYRTKCAIPSKDTSLLRAKHIVVLTCDRCGEIVKLVTEL